MSVTGATDSLKFLAPHLADYHNGDEKAEDLTVYEGGAVSNYAGGSNLLYIPADTYYTLKALIEAINRGDHEEIADATMRLIGIPMNLTSASGTVVGYLAGFGLVTNIPKVVGHVTLITGLLLCVFEGIVDAVSYRRQARFEEKFDFEFLSHLRHMIDFQENHQSRTAIDCMPELLEEKPEMLERLFGAEQGTIVKELMTEIRNEVRKQPHLTPSILNHYRPALEEISRQALIPNLAKLRDDYLHVHTSEILEIYDRLAGQGLKEEDFISGMFKELQNLSITKKKKLARRIRPWMVDEANQTIDPLLKGIVEKDPGAIREGLKLADDIYAQSSKKQLVHILGMAALVIAGLSLLAMAIAIPVTIPYILAGVAMTIALARAGVFSGTLDSRGWSFEPQKILPEFIRKKIFAETPRYPEIKHKYRRGITPVEMVREKHAYTQQLDLSKKGFKPSSKKEINASFPQLQLYV
ncbi:MAG: hypothetical protein H7A38_05630 [Chlamydiales bacterium]|nr:hypothetical protein [Chlamydiales bacterium]